MLCFAFSLSPLILFLQRQTGGMGVWVMMGGGKSASKFMRLSTLRSVQLSEQAEENEEIEIVLVVFAFLDVLILH